MFFIIVVITKPYVYLYLNFLLYSKNFSWIYKTIYNVYIIKILMCSVLKLIVLNLNSALLLQLFIKNIALSVLIKSDFC